jgi:6-phosphogluconolactonase/glucosamine-6-phosphate isomerase/deaminase
MPKSDAIAFGAQKIASRFCKDPCSHNLLSTGGTVEQLYAEIPAKLRGVDLSNMLLSNVDEWGFAGRPRLLDSDPRTFYSFMDRHLHNVLRQLGLDMDNVRFPSSYIEEGTILCDGMRMPEFDDYLASGNGISTYVAGLGQAPQEPANRRYDSHLAFMELSHTDEFGEDWLKVGTYSGMLDDDTRVNNVGYEGIPQKEYCPDLALTVGPLSLLQAVRGTVFLFAWDKKKAKALRGALEIPPGKHSSASLLQILAERNGVNIEVIMNAAAASELQFGSRFTAVHQ